ncbi:hypothetical protein JCM19037_1630 [Geomicrobium sp. JCM 19037]|uniref:hypothetical protein n=1 Tax=Geomicrobium sp. JCM 19037 TaxID=1460634 RepID=UPI00045F3850|nr:hypothetical protein [Geomicrobium sp. JCM 19037]GAK03315.1 hypothetical protein JCM19037_1630 [Geomicrobium sp. JCM 19037]
MELLIARLESKIARVEEEKENYTQPSESAIYADGIITGLKAAVHYAKLEDGRC